uniref:Uncharacterized protein n=1 Tax=Schistocephalus solidus TaxID=70667 RepID=A0A0X3NXB8_SCHSO
MGNCRSTQNSDLVATGDHWHEVPLVRRPLYRCSFFRKSVKQHSHAVQTNMSGYAFDETKSLEQQITTVKSAVCSEAVFVSHLGSPGLSREIMKKRYQVPLTATRLLKRSYSMVQVTDAFSGKVDYEEGGFKDRKEGETPVNIAMTSTGSGEKPCRCLCTSTSRDARPIPLAKSEEHSRAGDQSDSFPVCRVIATKPPRTPVGVSFKRRPAAEMPPTDPVSVTKTTPRTSQRKEYTESRDPVMDSRRTRRPSSSGVADQSSFGTQVQKRSPVKTCLSRTPPASRPGSAKIGSSAPTQKVAGPTTAGRSSVYHPTAKLRDSNAPSPPSIRPSHNLTPPRSRLEYTFYVKDDDAFRRPFVDRHVEAIVRACQCGLQGNSGFPCHHLNHKHGQPQTLSRPTRSPVPTIQCESLFPKMKPITPALEDELLASTVSSINQRGPDKFAVHQGCPNRILRSNE